MSNDQNNQYRYTTLLSDKPFDLKSWHPYKNLDTLGVNYYKDALVDVIKMCQMPNTIAIQGEWGSGKTSLMNGIKRSLCEGEGEIKIEDTIEIKNKVKVKIEVRVEDPKFYPVWINTWQFDLIDSPSQAVIDILKSIIQQITSYAADGNSNKYKTKLWSFFIISL